MKIKLTKEQALAKIATLAERERELVKTGSNGRNDYALYILRKELDTLRLKHKV